MPAALRLARSYDQAVAASWRGDEAARRAFAAWLAPFWRPDGPPEPGDAPAAVSVLGAGGRGIRWYDAGPAVVGYVPGRGGCYRVPVAATPGA